MKAVITLEDKDGAVEAHFEFGEFDKSSNAHQFARLIQKHLNEIATVDDEIEGVAV